MEYYLSITTNSGTHVHITNEDSLIRNNEDINHIFWLILDVMIFRSGTAEGVDTMDSFTNA